MKEAFPEVDGTCTELSVQRRLSTVKGTGALKAQDVLGQGGCRGLRADSLGLLSGELQ